MSKEKALELIVKLVKELKISSINVNGDVLDYKTIHKEKINVDDKICISKKYLKLFGDDLELLELVNKNFINEEFRKNFVVYNKESCKVNTFNVSGHAKVQFVKRFIAVYYAKRAHFDINFNILELMRENIDNVIELYENSLVYESVLIDELIVEFMQKSRCMSIENFGRHIDKRHINKRDDKYRNGDTQRYYSNPFLFILVDNEIVTSELYSSSYNYMYLNKIDDGSLNFIIERNKND